MNAIVSWHRPSLSKKGIWYWQATIQLSVGFKFSLGPNAPSLSGFNVEKINYGSMVQCWYIPNLVQQ